MNGSGPSVPPRRKPAPRPEGVGRPRGPQSGDGPADHAPCRPGGAGACFLTWTGRWWTPSYLHTLAWWQAFRQHGQDVPMAAIHQCVGMGGDRLVDSLLPGWPGPGRRRGHPGRHAAPCSPPTGRHCAPLTARGPACPVPRRGTRRRPGVVRAHAGPGGHAGVLGADASSMRPPAPMMPRHSKPAPDILVAALEAVGVRSCRRRLRGGRGVGHEGCGGTGHAGHRGHLRRQRRRTPGSRGRRGLQRAA